MSATTRPTPASPPAGPDASPVPGSPAARPARPAPKGRTPLEAGTNVVVLHGVLARDPDVRLLPSGDELVAYEVTVPRADGPAEGVPVVRFGAAGSSPSLAAGEAVVVVGRVRRRFFRAGGATQSRTEVVADRLVGARTPARARTQLAKALTRALEAVERPSG